MSFKPDTEENLEVHVDETDEGKNSGGEGGVPYEGEGVPGIGTIVKGDDYYDNGEIYKYRYHHCHNNCHHLR